MIRANPSVKPLPNKMLNWQETSGVTGVRSTKPLVREEVVGAMDKIAPVLLDIIKGVMALALKLVQVHSGNKRINDDELP